MKSNYLDLRKILIVVFLIPLFLAKPTFAAGTTVRCETQYGGTQVCVTTGPLQVNKKVCDPNKGSCDPASKDFSSRLVDNLLNNDHRFAPNEEVTFRISVKNVGDTTLSKVTVTDTPQDGFFQLVSGPLSYDLTDLKPGETRDQDLKLRVLDTTKLPQNNVTCVNNTAEATSTSGGDKDMSQVCLERKVLGVAVKELPPTGPEHIFLTLFGSVAGLAAGFRFSKFGRQNNPDGNNYHLVAENRFNEKEVN